MISPSRPNTGALRPSLNTAIRFDCPGTSTRPTNLYGIGGSGGGGGGPVGTGATGGGCVRRGGGGGAAFGLKRNRSRSADTGLARSALSACRCTSIVLGAGAVVRAVRTLPLSLDAGTAGADGAGHMRYASTARTTTSAASRSCLRRSVSIGSQPVVGRQLEDQ